MDLVTANDHSTQPPQTTEPDGTPTWITRGANFVIAISKVRAGSRLEIKTVPDEHMVLLPDCGVRIEWTEDSRHESRVVAGNSLLIVPPGDCTIVAEGDGQVVRCFSHHVAALAALASNAADYAAPRPKVAPLTPWPAPKDGDRLRHYDLAAYVRPDQKTRMFRCRNLMINVLKLRTEPRDIHALSPHSHKDFEQASLSLQGVHLHHLRYPWVPDMDQWRDDHHLEIGSPSVIVIPPEVVHTTRNINQGPALLVDVFAPPRLDFSLRDGMVCNADEYPLPA